MSPCSASLSDWNFKMSVKFLKSGLDQFKVVVYVVRTVRFIASVGKTRE